MGENDPTVFSEGHGPLSSYDERTGGVAGAVIVGAIGYEKAGPTGALIGGLAGWAGGEALVDKFEE